MVLFLISILVLEESGSNDASAEYVAQVTEQWMDNANIHYQTAELGRVDQGGGGTIAYILGNYNMDVIDAGIAVLNMHAPMEIVSKVDVYETYQAYKAFLKMLKKYFILKYLLSIFRQYDMMIVLLER